jgi:hypothetical protein
MQKSTSLRNTRHFSRSVLAFALLITTLTACSQESQLDKFYNKYHNSGEGSTDLSNSSFSINANFSSEDKKSWKNKITLFRMLVLENKGNASLHHDWDDLSQSLRKDNFDDLLTIRKGSDNAHLLSKDGKGDQKELVFMASGKDGSCVFIHVKGKFDAKDMEQVQASFQDGHGKGLQIN